MANEITLADAVGAHPRAPTPAQRRAERREADARAIEERNQAEALRLQSGIFARINNCADLDDIKDVLREMADQLGLS